MEVNSLIIGLTSEQSRQKDNAHAGSSKAVNERKWQKDRYGDQLEKWSPRIFLRFEVIYIFILVILTLYNYTTMVTTEITAVNSTYYLQKTYNVLSFS